MAKPASKIQPQHLRASDLRAIAQLATQGTVGVIRIAEGVHQSVWRTLGAPAGALPGQTRGLTGMIYKSVKGITQLVGLGLEAVLAKLQPLLESTDATHPGTPEREAVLAALNGVMGDHLAASNNPLTTSMTLRYRGEALNWQALPPASELTGKVLLLIHGLCMNDLQWHTHPNPNGRQGQEKKIQALDHGEALASALGYTPVYLRYNSGLHISQNGHELSALLEQLRTHWPTPIEELSVVAHSMGGLLIRSAVQDAQQEGVGWPTQLKNIVFLGTPHHGAPLERAGNWVDLILASTPYTAPFALVGHLRSAGITDLRYGYLLDADWQGHGQFRRKADSRQLVPLPMGVACYAVAATTAAKRSTLPRQHLMDAVFGDGLVPLPSALGQHTDPRRRLAFTKASQWIAYRTNHMALLSSPDVTRQLLRWLTPKPA